MMKNIFVALSLLTFGAGCVESGAVLPDSMPTESVVVDDSPKADETMPSENGTWSFQGELPADKITNKQIRVTTDKGDIVFELLPEVAPITVSNFVYLTEGGYYDGLNFHRREESFVIQGGDPMGNGMGGPGYSIPAEFNDVKHERGMVAMARSMDPDSAGSQFYITLGPAYFLDNNYTVFGRVLEGMEIVDQIRVGDVMTKVTVEDKE
jgi:peptidylprolyl isomerase/peptidyl-prolyl cis-trans isomerase B (cyclophilin B)